jgi:hypothetical protein
LKIQHIPVVFYLAWYGVCLTTMIVTHYIFVCGRNIFVAKLSCKLMFFLINSNFEVFVKIRQFFLKKNKKLCEIIDVLVKQSGSMKTLI